MSYKQRFQRLCSYHTLFLRSCQTVFKIICNLDKAVGLPYTILVIQDWETTMNKYEEIARCLKDRIRSGAYIPGQKLPSEAELCREFSASRLSVRSAIGQLAAQGLIRRIRARAPLSVRVRRQGIQHFPFRAHSSAGQIFLSCAGSWRQRSRALPPKEPGRRRSTICASSRFRCSAPSGNRRWRRPTRRSICFWPRPHRMPPSGSFFRCSGRISTR